jgi:hypothetical protein
VDQIRATSADIRAENIGSIAFIVYAAGYLGAQIRRALRRRRIDRP